MVAWPVFPGYVFARFTVRDVHTVLTTPGVSTIIRTNGRPAPIPDEELESIRTVVRVVEETGTAPVLRPLVTEGDRVVVTSGPFRGVSGYVVQLRGRCRILVGITSVGQGLELEVSSGALKRID